MPLDPSGRLWILGVGSFGQDVASACEQVGLHVMGFTQTHVTITSVGRYPCVPLHEITYDGADIIIGVFNPAESYSEIASVIPGGVFNTIFFPWDIYPILRDQLGWRYWLREPEFLDHHESDLSRILEMLSDEESKDCFVRVCEFRKGRDLSYSSFMSTDQQYFNDLTLSDLDGPVHYLDGGALDGDSVFALDSKCAVGPAYLFEPDSENFLALVSKVGFSGVNATCVPLALSDKSATFQFSPGKGGSSHISDDGSISVTTVSVDQFLGGQQIDLMKFDVEGFELAALQGAQGTIRKHRPRLALSCYHRPEDLWTLPDYIRSITDSYDYYFRQHAANSFDLCFYAIPQCSHR